MILGRTGMGGRLSENMRQKQGMAYYVFSGLEADKGAGPWTAMAGVNPQNIERAIQAILHEIELFKREGPTDEEVSDTKAYLTGISVLGLETNGGLASSLLAIECFGLGLDYIVRYPEIINAITKEEIKAIACKYLSTENYVLAVAGPPNP
jgi:zinc protease